MKAILAAKKNNGKIYISGELKEDVAVEYNEDIIAVKPAAVFSGLGCEEVLELHDEILAPGFIDVHIHGYGGSDTMDASPDALRTVSRSLAKLGVTSFLPTTMSMPVPQIRNALEAVRNFMVRSSAADVPRDGAKILGVHLEGPFINPKYKGAQHEKDILLPDRRLLEEYGDLIRIVTVAPETEGALTLIEEYADRICFSLGHSGCDFSTAKTAFSCGARAVTHLFNAMSPLHHRNPGLTGAALMSEEVYAELICDDVHVNPALYDMVRRLKGADRIMLISDCIRAGGLEDGLYDLGGQPVEVLEGRCALSDGTIAGSVLRYDQALKNMLRGSGASLEDVLKMTAQNQAHYLRMQAKIGVIAVRRAADFVVLNPELKPVRTIVSGTSVWSEDAEIKRESETDQYLNGKVNT